MEEVTNCLNIVQNPTDPMTRSAAEKRLMDFMQTRNSWKVVLNSLSNEREEGVLFYMAAVLEYWTGTSAFNSLDDGERDAMKQQLLNSLLRRFKGYANFVGTKFALVFVRLGRQVWLTRSDNPNFLELVFGLTTNHDTVLLGLSLLKLFSEEIMKSSNDILFSRREELRSNLRSSSHIILKRYYEILLECAKQSSDVAEPIQKACLEGLLHYFSWVSPELSFEPNLTKLILDIIKKNDHTAVLAFECINEVLETAVIPKNRQDFLFIVFREIFDLLRALSEVDLSKIGHPFLLKFIQFCSLFASKHFHRVEAMKDFPMVPLLELIRTFTFRQKSLEGFTEILRIWKVLCEYLDMAYLQTGKEEDPKFLGYAQIFLAIGRDLYCSLLWEKNGDLLEVLEGEADGDLKEVFKDVISILIDIGNLFQEPFVALFAPEVLSQLRSIPNKLSAVALKGASSESRKIYKDGVTSLMFAAELAELIGIRSDYNSLMQIVEIIVNLIAYFLSNNLANTSKFTVAFTSQLFSTLAAFEFPLLALIQINPSEEDDPVVHRSKEILPQLLQSLVGVAMSVLKAGGHSRVSCSALQLLRMISRLSKESILTHQDCRALFTSPFLHYNDSVDASKELFLVLASLLTIPLPNSKSESQESFQQRVKQYQSLVSSSFYGSFVRMVSNPNFISSGEYRQEKSVKEVNFALAVTRHLLEAITGFAKVTKEIQIEIFKSIIGPLLPIMKFYAPSLATLESILDTIRDFVICFGALVSSEVIESILRAVVEITPPSEISRIVSSQDSHARSFLIKMLEMLESLLEDQNRSAHITNALVDLVGSSIVPVLGDVLNPAYPIDCIDSFLKLLKSIIVDRQAAGVEWISVFAKCLKSKELQIVQQSLTILTEIEVILFRMSNLSTIVFPLCQTLLDSMIEGNATLYREDMLALLFKLARTNFQEFYQRFLPAYLQAQRISDSAKQSLVANFKAETDEPSFVSQLDRFAFDCAFFQTNSPSRS